MHITPHNSNPDVAQDVPEQESYSNDPQDFFQERNEEDAEIKNLDCLQPQLEHHLASLFLKLQAV